MSALSRKDIASRLGVSVHTITKSEKTLGLDMVKVTPNKRVVRYPVEGLKRLDWWRRLEGG